ncbi:helix-turn-helix domain-containing protein [Mesorhizobium sp. M0254]|nr:helix-turn-helix domain-containing protein [Mesorhizobium sp. C395A]
MVALCAAYGISRKNGYKWLGRYRTFGPEGLHDLPRAPLNHGRATAQDLVERIVAAKELHPLWGPKKIVARLRRTAPEFMWPSASTVGAILARHGLVSARKRPRLCIRFKVLPIYRLDTGRQVRGSVNAWKDKLYFGAATKPKAINRRSLRRPSSPCRDLLPV